MSNFKLISFDLSSSEAVGALKGLRELHKKLVSSETVSVDEWRLAGLPVMRNRIQRLSENNGLFEFLKSQGIIGKFPKPTPPVITPDSLWRAVQSVDRAKLPLKKTIRVNKLTISITLDGTPVKLSFVIENAIFHGNMAGGSYDPLPGTVLEKGLRLDLPTPGLVFRDQSEEVTIQNITPPFKDIYGPNERLSYAWEKSNYSFFRPDKSTIDCCYIKKLNLGPITRAIMSFVNTLKNK